jgi:hypothetical protein
MAMAARNAALVAQENAVDVHRQHVDAGQIPGAERREQLVAADLLRVKLMSYGFADLRSGAFGDYPSCDRVFRSLGS